MKPPGRKREAEKKKMREAAEGRFLKNLWKRESSAKNQKKTAANLLVGGCFCMIKIQGIFRASYSGAGPQAP